MATALSVPLMGNLADLDFSLLSKQLALIVLLVAEAAHCFFRGLRTLAPVSHLFLQSALDSNVC